ncbi:hypothetical protein ACGFR6_19115 [Streptomyces sp. NPDC048567]|uniref:hypothetical protein n=1 Tax=Streptomyces sp. NPDC048567 TaxID=3365570 RepID=UPI0037105C58
MLDTPAGIQIGVAVELGDMGAEQPAELQSLYGLVQPVGVLAIEPGERAALIGLPLVEQSEEFAYSAFTFPRRVLDMRDWLFEIVVPVAGLRELVSLSHPAAGLAEGVEVRAEGGMLHEADGIELWHSAVVRSRSRLFVHVEARGVGGDAWAPRGWPMAVSWASGGETDGGGTNSGGEDRAEVIQWFAADEADEGNTLRVEVAPLGAEFLIALATPV